MEDSKLTTKRPDLCKDWIHDRNTKSLGDITYGSQYKAWWRCVEGHEWEATVKSRVQGSRCPYCTGKKVESGVNDLGTLYPDLAAQWHPSKNTLKSSEVSVSSNKKVWWLGPCGHEWEAVVYGRSARGYGCPYCARRLVEVGRTDLASTHPEIASQWHPTKNTVRPSEVVSGASYTAWWVCERCTHEWKTDVVDRVRGNGCTKCYAYGVKTGTNDLATAYPDIASQWHTSKNVKTPSEVAKYSNKTFWWTCSEGHEWVSSVCNRVAGSDCPDCSRKISVSRGESELLDYVTSLFPDTVGSDRVTLSGLEIDVYVPSKNFGFEYNGLYWHSDKFLSKDSHKTKHTLAQNNGIRLMTIWEDDWRDRQAIIKKMIRHKLGVSNDTRVYARKTVIDCGVSKAEASAFMNKHHIQGFVGSTHKIGLRDPNDDLVALMLLKTSGDGLRLERYATSCQVVGGQSKLLKWVENTLSYDKITTFADLMISDGNLYEKTGWVKDAELNPDYSYVYKDARTHKFNFRLKNFKNNPSLMYKEGLSESQLAKLNNLPRIYDAGKIRYIKVR